MGAGLRDPYCVKWDKWVRGDKSISLGYQPSFDRLAAAADYLGWGHKLRMPGDDEDDDEEEEGEEEEGEEEDDGEEEDGGEEDGEEQEDEES